MKVLNEVQSSSNKGSNNTVLLSILVNSDNQQQLKIIATNYMQAEYLTISYQTRTAITQYYHNKVNFVQFIYKYHLEIDYQLPNCVTSLQNNIVEVKKT